MKAAIFIALAVLLVSVGCYVRWEILNEVRFTRMVCDLGTLPREDLLSGMMCDAWGNDFVSATATGGGRSYEYLFSPGPDGTSRTIGNDPDDITSGTDYHAWIESIYPSRLTKRVMIGSFAVLVSLLAASLPGRRRKSNQPNKTQ